MSNTPAMSPLTTAPPQAVRGEAALEASRIHPRALMLASAAPTGLLSDSVNASLRSVTPSSTTGTDTVPYRAPAGIVSVPDVVV